MLLDKVKVLFVSNSFFYETFFLFVFLMIYYGRETFYIIINDG